MAGSGIGMGGAVSEFLPFISGISVGAVAMLDIANIPSGGTNGEDTLSSRINVTAQIVVERESARNQG
jgi:hypothetical protein